MSGRTGFFLEQALLPDGIAEAVRLEVEAGTITAVSAGATARSGDRRLRGLTIPGLPNLHSHTFQRGMAGLAERRGPAADSFWTWREVMYRFLGRLGPDDVEAVAAQACAEMLEGGFTTFGEFHYLHNDTDGRPYADPGELAGRIVAAAAATGIGLTLLPCFYAQGGFGDVPPSSGQRRFVHDRPGFERLLARCRELAALHPGTVVGVAPHSLRAVRAADLAAVVAMAPEGPVHIHAAEQVREVEECLAATGARPVEFLLDRVGIDERWCLIHATHMTDAETDELARSGAVAGLCPITEASLGDGIFPGVRFAAAGGRFGIGTDSNIAIDGAAELRQMEYAQRLLHRSRNVLSVREGESTGTRLLREALAGGAQALGQLVGALEPGRRADLVALDTDHPALAAAPTDALVDVWIFAGDRAAIGTVVAGGLTVVESGRHRDRDRIADRFRSVVRRLAAA